MTFNEYIEQTTNKQWMSDYDFFFRYVKKAYGNLLCLYPLETLDNQIDAFIIDNQAELTSIQATINNIAMLDDINNWGNIVDSNSVGTNDMTGLNVQSYSGYNADGDYQKLSNEQKSNSSANAKSRSINFLESIFKINDSTMYNYFKRLAREFIVFFQTLYVPEEV